ncbi:MAG: hypothetical protein ACRYFX_18810 [Janthinobacterium lividum]
MPDFVRRIEATIMACRRAGQAFSRDEELQVLVPVTAYHLALGDVDTYFNSLPTAMHKVVFQNEGDKNGKTQTLQLLGVVCHMIPAEVPGEIFQIVLPTPQPES